EPRFLFELLGMIADTPATHERVKAILDREEKAPALDPKATEGVRTWLMQRSRFFRDDLVKSAAAASFKEGKYMTGEDSLRALARLDWAKAEPVLEKHVAGEDPRLAALAIAIRLEHASTSNAVKAAEELRTRL